MRKSSIYLLFVASFLLLFTPRISQAVSVGLLLSLWDYDTGVHEYYNNFYPTDPDRKLYTDFGKMISRDVINDPVDYGSTQSFTLWAFAVKDATNYHLEIQDITSGADDHYFISMFRWQPDNFTHLSDMSNIPASDGLSLEEETRSFFGSANTTGWSAMYVLFRPEEGYSWTEDLHFSLFVEEVPPDWEGIGAITAMKFNDIRIPVGPAPVPIPGAALLFGSSLFGIIGIKRRLMK